MNRVTAAVVLYNGEKLIPQLSKTLSSLPADMAVVVYDSGSTDASVREAQKLPGNPVVIKGDNHGFGFGNNRCLEKIETPYTLLLNSDASIDADSLGNLVEFLDANPDYAGVQPLIRLWDWQKVTVSCGVFLTPYGEAWDSRFMHLELSPMKNVLHVPAITAAVSLWRTEALKSVNGFDEDFFMYFEDADLSLRLCSSGWKLGVVRSSEARHMVGASSVRKKALEWEFDSSIRIFRKYMGDGKLTAYWWKREARIILYTILHGNSPLWRFASILKSMKSKVETVFLPEEVRAILFGDPMDYPLPRAKSKSRGPGWQGDTISPWGGIRTEEKSLKLEITSLKHAVTGAVSNSRGEILKRFCIPAETARKVEVAETSPLVYIHCDSSADRVEVKVL